MKIEDKEFLLNIKYELNEWANEAEEHLLAEGVVIAYRDVKFPDDNLINWNYNLKPKYSFFKSWINVGGIDVWFDLGPFGHNMVGFKTKQDAVMFRLKNPLQSVFR